MTDRTQILTVALDARMRVDDVEEIINAIKMVRGVADVKYEVSSGIEGFLYQATRGREIYAEVDALLREKLLGKQ